MCGICGRLSLRGPVDRELLLRMNETLAHRGPDSSGLFLEGPVGLAMQRLAIIDLVGGDQPLANESGTVTVIQNGEIYNHQELHRELEERGHRFRSASDTEVLVHLYEEAGPQFVRRLRGMFALALWDQPRRRLVLARDAFGIKPLFYRADGDGISFASELKALLADPSCPRALDLDALEAYLATNAVPAPLTIFRGIRKLPPGHLLVVENGDLRVERYVRPRVTPAAQVRREDPEQLAVELREKLRDSVRAHLVSDVPVGVMLSGGIDSSAIVALAAEEYGGRLKTFSIGFSERSFDERHLARQVAARFDTDHHELVVEADAAALIPELVEAYDEPFADSSAVPTYFVSRLAAEHVKVALSGEGGDELFGGYYTYVADALAARVSWLARLARPLVERLPASTAKASFDFKAKRFVRAAHLPALARHQGWREIFSDAERATVLLPDRRAAHHPLHWIEQRYAETAAAQPIARFQDVDIGSYLADDLLTKTDRASMAHSLEVRVPFCDLALAEFALSLPDELRVHRLAKKRLLRRAVAPLLPPDILAARKQGFSIPLATWLRRELYPLAREILSPAQLRAQGVFDERVIGNMLARHASGREDLSRPLWNVLVFCVWHERWLPSSSG